MSQHEIERRTFPKPVPPLTEAPDTPSLRSTLNGWTAALIEQVEADGGPVNESGSVHPLVDMVCALVETGVKLRQVRLEQQRFAEMAAWRSNRPLKPGKKNDNS
ncbi:hypothetical protein ACFXDI_21085 [Streptomyces mirabilis]|uniref:hypothetical protein n=1 Tax=Streptomyces mirabilis TaxID=68239 RepID=UPI0036A8DE02